MSEDERLERPIHPLALPARALMPLDRAGIGTVGEFVLLGRRGRLTVRGFGQARLRAVRDALASIDLRLGDASDAVVWTWGWLFAQVRRVKERNA